MSEIRLAVGRLFRGNSKKRYIYVVDLLTSKAATIIMAKFTPGFGMGEIRNKIGGAVFSRNRGGAMIRTRITPINRRSSLQTTRRQVLSSFSASWRGLTAAQIAGWNAAAPNFPTQDNLGQTVLLSGQQLYVRCNASLSLIGGTPITSAPVTATFASIAFGAITATAAGTFSIAFTPTPVPTGYNLVVLATRPVSAGKSFIGQSAFKYVTNVAPAGTSPLNAFAAYSALFGALTGLAGQKIFVQAYLMQASSGLVGIPIRTSVTIS